MRKIQRVISEIMLFTCGMCAGKCIFWRMELWKAMIIGMAIFVTLWIIWDGIEENKNQNQRKENRREHVA